MLSQRKPRQHNETHLDFIRGLPCLLCLDNTSTEAAHIRFSDPRAAKRHCGIAERPDDRWTLPLCNTHHREQHAMNEREFWQAQRLDPIFYALALWNVTGDAEAAETIIRNARGW